MKPATRRLLAILVFLAVIALLVVPKLVSFDRSSAGDAKAPAASAPRVLQVEVVELAPGRLVEELATTGTLRADEQIELVSEVAGKVVAVHFQEGRRVESGQLLLELDDATLDAERERIRFRLELAERREARQRELLEQGVISQDGYDLVLNELNVLRADLQLVEARLAKTELRAPFAGVIGLRRVSPGSYLSPQTPIATLQNLSTIKIDFSVPEKYSTRVATGDTVDFTVKGSERQLTGTIFAIEPGVDSATRSMQLRARCDNPDGSLLPGSFADVRLLVEEVDDALSVPSVAVVPELGGRKVFVEQDGVAHARKVETGIRSDDAVQLVSGVEAGERVIVTAIQQLREGLPVEVTATVAASTVVSEEAL